MKINCEICVLLTLTAVSKMTAYTRKLVKHLTEVQQNVELSMVLEMVSTCVIERLRSM